MGRTKKDATDAIARLSSYLQRDQSGLRMLNAISRYLGELRQTQAALKVSVESLEEWVEATQEKLNSTQKQLDSQTSYLIQEKSLYHQAKVDAKTAESKTTSLQSKIENLEAEIRELRDNIPMPPPELIPSEEGFQKVFDDLRQRIKHLPVPVGHKWGKDSRKASSFRTMVYDTRDFVRQFEPEEYKLLGMFVTVCTLMNFPVTFEVETKMGIIGSLTERQQHKQVRWLSKWLNKFVRVSPAEDKMWDEALGMHKPRPGG